MQIPVASWAVNGSKEYMSSPSNAEARCEFSNAQCGSSVTIYSPRVNRARPLASSHGLWAILVWSGASLLVLLQKLPGHLQIWLETWTVSKVLIVPITVQEVPQLGHPNIHLRLNAAAILLIRNSHVSRACPHQPLSGSAACEWAHLQHWALSCSVVVYVFILCRQHRYTA